MQQKLFNYSEDKIKTLLPRLAMIEDVDEIQNLLTTFSFVHKASIKQNIENERIVVIGDINNVVGVIIINAYHNTISDMIINQNYRGNKFAQKLFNFMIDKNNINGLIIKATYKPYSSIGFWESLGFKITGKIYQKKGTMQLMEMVWFRYNEVIIK